jgi:hypothetical protein
MRFEHDEDDPPPEMTWVDEYWHYANRWAEWVMAYSRLLGII